MMHRLTLIIVWLAILFLIQVGGLKIAGPDKEILTPAIANPFTQNKRVQKKEDPPKSARFQKVAISLIQWQQQLKSKMSRLIREAKQTGRYGPLVIILGTAFLYGAVHAAGPGHGKAVAMSYIAGTRTRLWNSILFSNILAFTHALSGILLVLVVKGILHGSIRTSLDQATRVTQTISFSLITLLGCFMVVKAGIGFWPQKAPKNVNTGKPVESYLSAFTIGFIPCPGVVMVMLFCMSMEATVLGVFAGTAIGAGMALTISLVVVLGTLGKKAVLTAAGEQSMGNAKLEAAIQLMAGIGVTVLGALLLSAT